MPIEDYSFVARTANWRNGNGNCEVKSILLDIRPYDQRAGDHIKGVWEKMKQAITTHHKLAGEEHLLPGWTSWKVHEWCTKTRDVEDRLKYIAWAGDSVAGFMFLRPNFPSNFVSDKSVSYVEDLAAAPGNLRTEIWCRPIKFVGLALLAYAAAESLDRGLDGSFGLHAADDEALRWYENLNAIRGGRLFRSSVVGVSAPKPIGDEARSKQYFETYPEGAAELAREYQNV